MVQNGGFVWGLVNFQILFWVLEIPDIFLGWTVDAGPEPMYVEKMRVLNKRYHTKILYWSKYIHFKVLV